MDDYDLVASSANPLLALSELLPQARDIGLHLVLARVGGGAGRAMFEPVIQRLREMGSPGLIMSGSKDEGPIFSVTPQTLPPGRGYLEPAAPTPASSKPLRHHPAGGGPALASGLMLGDGCRPVLWRDWQNAICHTTGQHVQWWRSISAAVMSCARDREAGRQEPDPGLRRLRVAEWRRGAARRGGWPRQEGVG